MKDSANQTIRISGYGKAQFYLDSNSRILDCDGTLCRLLKINKNELLSTKVSQHYVNQNFIQSVKKADNEGISNFKGIVLLGSTLKSIYLETVLLKGEASEHFPACIICIVLDYNTGDPETKPAHSTPESASIETDDFNASVSLQTTDGRVLYISPSIEVLLGYTSDEFMSMRPLDLIYPEDVTLVNDVAAKLNKGCGVLHSQYRMVHKNGSVIHVASSSYLTSGPSDVQKQIVSLTWDRSTQVNIETALKRSEQKYYHLAMNLPTGISLISSNGRLLEVNDAMRKIMEIPADTPIQEMNFFEIEVMNRFEINRQLIKCIETKQIINGNVTFRISNKISGKYLTYSFVPVLKNNGEVDIIIGYVTDLTKQMKAEIESRERAEFLNLVINSIKSPFFVKDEKHKWVILNDAAVEMMGQNREALVGKSDYDLYPREQADIFWKYDELVFKTGNSSNEEQITWADGEIHTIVTYKQLYTEQSTGNKFIVGTIHDISSYKKIEDELRRSEIKYRELFDNANDFIMTIDLEGNITNANRTLLNFLKTDLEEFTKHTIFEFITEENLAAAYEFRNKVLDGNQQGAFEINAMGMDGKPVIYEVKASLIKVNGELNGVQCVFSDVTERKETQRKLENYNHDLLELNKTKDKFFSIIAHDLRNPYSSMIGFSEMLLEDLDQMPKDEIRESLKIIHTSAKNSFNLLDNLLAWSRLETGHIAYDPTQLTLIESVENAINVLFSIAYQKKIEINNLINPDVKVFADKNMLNTILNNLIMNSIKFTQPGGDISIYSQVCESENKAATSFIKISVADTGIGMDAETLKLLFTSKKLTSLPGTSREQGSGLGLLLTREMVEKHGGEISAESTPGKGSVFSFTIPAYKHI